TQRGGPARLHHGGRAFGVHLRGRGHLGAVPRASGVGRAVTGGLRRGPPPPHRLVTPPRRVRSPRCRVRRPRCRLRTPPRRVRTLRRGHGDENCQHHAPT